MEVNWQTPAPCSIASEAETRLDAAQRKSMTNAGGAHIHVRILFVDFVTPQIFSQGGKDDLESSFAWEEDGTTTLR